MFAKKMLLLFSFPILFAGLSCNMKGGQGINFFSVQDDIALGEQVSQEIDSNPKEFPLLPEKGNEEIYSYIRGLRDKILNTGRVAYRDEFAWEVKIIKDDETLNAFCTPGGHIYVYTGLIKFLDSEDQLLGVMGHEIAHAAMRHSTRQLTKIYGIQILASIVTGKSDPGLVEQIALGLASLKFSRSHETEADSYSVEYLCGTTYNAAGAAGFFKKLEGQSQPPEFLSTHPNPGNRVENMEKQKQEKGCKGNLTNESKYAQIKALL
ncbi:MAG: M48 family metalloprotease [Saprospiraceae bacterium]|nr:M48 family metalloprotease [Saprospiraceae bacterium]MCB0624997.1 M48 family metalloprotease [Saprospiraceae bacterium]MCB0676095.1 M48 family metalloprotease [Saprospiraceae bacterium]MCB0681399.1 M48 family metalloprotease [Saprospiraceae bacterium]